MRWHKAYRLDTLDDDWEYWPKSSGIYLILGPRGLARAAGKSRSRVLYIGQARNIRNRLWDAWYAQHPGTGMLWHFPEVARTLIGTSLKDFDPGRAIGLLAARVAFPIPMAALNRIERAVIFAYYYRFGELPPLNAAMPKRWDRDRPTSELIQWASRGLRVDG